MTADLKHIELIFPDNAHIPYDLEIVEPATYDRPGRARLAAARVEPIPPGGAGLSGASRVMSANGGAFIGVISEGSPLPPYNFSYLLDDAVDKIVEVAEENYGCPDQL